ncbi:MAG: DUF5615 family PIN-like protein [Candidatus Riflebacteria bacterium]|nr:DUF5615 family PIN-like protein [Candidatus Riflebacteria bacterium]
MGFFVDESVDQPLAEALRSLGYPVRCVVETEPGLVDEEVLNRANAEGLILVTADKDFGELVFRKRMVAAGVILVRLGGLAMVEKVRVFQMCIADHSRELAGSFTVVSGSGLRVRRRGLNQPEGRP